MFSWHGHMSVPLLCGTTRHIMRHGGNVSKVLQPSAWLHSRRGHGTLSSVTASRRGKMHGVRHNHFSPSLPADEQWPINFLMLYAVKLFIDYISCLKPSITIYELKVLVYIWLLLMQPPSYSICGFSFSVLCSKKKGRICMTRPATAPSIKFHPIEDEKWNKTISVNGLAATDLLHSLTRSDSPLYVFLFHNK